MVPQDSKANEDKLEPLARLDRKVLKDLRDHVARKANKGSKDRWEDLVLWAIKVNRALEDKQELQENVDHRDNLDGQDPMGKLDRKARKANVDRQVPLDPRVQQVHKGNKVNVVNQVYPASEVLLERRAQQDNLEDLVQWVKKVNRDSRDLLEL